MEFLVGICLLIPLLLNQWMFFDLIKKVKPSRSITFIGVSFFVGMFICIFYTIIVVTTMPMENHLPFALGLGLAIFIGIVFKIYYTLTFLK